MRRFGLKHSARALAEAAGVPLAPGTGLLVECAQALMEAERIGFPVMLKSTAGGGGIGMQLCRDRAELAERFESVQRLGRNNFGDDRVYLEKFVQNARHIEVQIFGDGRGGVVALGERDCSLQRRNQKVIEETPAPGISPCVRARLHESAVALARSAGYESAGTVEFIYDADEENFYFLEVNTRLQVEHGVTEAVFGVDLVEWMIRQAAGEFLLPAQDALAPKGAAIEARLYAEDPARGFQPCTGLLTEVRFPANLRVDSWIETGTTVTPYYDPMLAKLIACGDTRETAIKNLATGLDDMSIWGIETNLAYLRTLLDLPDFASGQMTTATLTKYVFRPNTVTVIAPGTQSSLQDFPGRLGFWDVGVPPSGPMDDRNFRLANFIVGNPEGAVALELTLTGPTLLFNSACVIALTGARMNAKLDGQDVKFYVPLNVLAGQTLILGAIEGPGARTYLAVRHGFAAPTFLGSSATFSLGGFGGHATGVLKTADVLRLRHDGAISPPDASHEARAPELSTDWSLGVLAGPHGAPDFFTHDDIKTFFSSAYQVHHNSARTGVRLIGPKPRWARTDGGEAGLHPSNIHDNAYAIGAIDFTGDMPIILGPDGPSLGGFVCPAVIVREDMWKIGQLRPGDTVRFVRRDLTRVTALPPPEQNLPDGVLRRRDGDISVCYRIAGEQNLLVEYGPLVLDIALRLRVHALIEAVRAENLPGIVDLTPGIRSLQLHYNPRRISLSDLLESLERIENTLPDSENIEVSSRIVHLPLSWDDGQARLAIQKYQERVRPDAPWCPSNIEFIRRINGLDSIEDVRRIVFEASYLVLGLGDVYLGAPVATPTDPRQRLVTTKYNPARTWTPQNAVGIGGAYLCVYGMEGPGGYQLVGRTIQMWNSWRTTDDFVPGKPWLLRFFDQIRFFPVSADELAEAREACPYGRYKLRVEETVFRARDYADFLAHESQSIRAFQATQRAAFEAERQSWKAAGLDRAADDDVAPEPPADALLPGETGVFSPVPGTVWKIEVAAGCHVEQGQALLILESMKMEMRVNAPVAGTLAALRCQLGGAVMSGQLVAVIVPGGTGSSPA